MALLMRTLACNLQASCNTMGDTHVCLVEPLLPSRVQSHTCMEWWRLRDTCLWQQGVVPRPGCTCPKITPTGGRVSIIIRLPTRGQKFTNTWC